MDPLSSDPLVPAPSRSAPSCPAAPEPPHAHLSGPFPRGSESEADPDDTQEVDVWWGSYAGRTMWPSFVACGLLTAAIALAAWHWWDAYNAHPQLARYTAYGLAGLVWLVQLLRWGYRTVSMNYRVTTYRLFCDRGFRHPAAGSVELARIKDVRAECDLLERLAGVGRVRILTEDGDSPLILEGVHGPDHVAALILGWANKARRLKETPTPSLQPAAGTAGSAARD